jgi:hypothetical protein
VSDPDPSAPPAGWYPDPAGQRQWRIWNGRAWTERVRPYGEPPGAWPDRLARLRAQDRLMVASIAYYGGLGALVDAYHHRPGTRLGLSAGDYDVIVVVALGAWFLGHLAYTRAAITVCARRPWLAGVPLLNTVAWVRWSLAGASYPIATPGRRSLSRREAADTAAFVQVALLAALAGAGAEPLARVGAVAGALQLLPALAAVLNRHWARAVRDDLAG